MGSRRTLPLVLRVWGLPNLLDLNSFPQSSSMKLSHPVSPASLFRLSHHVCLNLLFIIHVHLFARSTAAVQQQYEGQRKVSTGHYSQHFAAPPQVQHSGSLPHFNMPSPAPYYMQQQQQQQRGGFASSDRYTDGGSARGGDGRQNPE